MAWRLLKDGGVMVIDDYRKGNHLAQGTAGTFFYVVFKGSNYFYGHDRPAVNE